MSKPRTRRSAGSTGPHSRRRTTAASTPAAAIDADRAPVELPKLVALVRARRVLRLGGWLAVLALPGWLAVLISGMAASTEDSRTWNWYNDHGNRGFVIILVVLGLDLFVALGVRLAGDAGALAAQLVPMVRRVPEPVIRDGDSRDPSRLLDLGGRTNRLPRGSRVAIVVLSLLVATFAGIGLLAGNKIHAQYRASHGHGGPIVTLGKDSHITRRVYDEGANVRYPGHYDYYISSPRGEALVEGDGKPKTGTRLAIISSLAGLSAVHVGGYSWVTSLVVTVVSALLGCLTVFFLARRIRRRDPGPRVVPLTTTLERLGAGSRVTVQPVPPTKPERAGPAVPLAVAPFTGRTSEEVEQGVRRGALLAGTGVLALLVVGGLIVAFA